MSPSGTKKPRGYKKVERRIYMTTKELSRLEEIIHACETRFRPILMTTFAAMIGAIPIALGIGGMTAVSRRPLGLVIVGGLTLFLTPVIFIYLERLREWISRKKAST